MADPSIHIIKICIRRDPSIPIINLIYKTFWATIYKTVRPVLSDRCPVCLSVTLVYCGQTVGWIKMKLCMKVGLGPGHIVLDGDPAPNFQPMSVVAKRLDGSTCHLVLDGDRASKGAQSPNYRPMSVVAKRLDGSRYHLVRS